MKRSNDNLKILVLDDAATLLLVFGITFIIFGLLAHIRHLSVLGTVTIAVGGALVATSLAVSFVITSLTYREEAER